MPDNDLVPRHVRRIWRTPCEVMLGGQDSLLVGHEIDRAVTATINQSGLPSATSLVRAMRESILYSDTARYEAARTRYAREGNLTDLASQVIRQADQVMEIGRADLMSKSEDDSALELITNALRRFAESALCGSDAVAEQMMKDGSSFAEVRQRQQDCLDAAQYETIASRVAAGDGARIVTPASLVAKLPTAELLDQEL